MLHSTAALPDNIASPIGLSRTLLTLSLAGVALLRPRFEAAEGNLSDFAWVHLNPAGQQLLNQPECPAESLLTLFPTAQADGLFEACRQAFLTGEQRRIQLKYPAAGLDRYLLLVAQRHEDLLVVSFTTTNDQPYPAAAEALRTSQLPAAVAVFAGPTLVLTYYNELFEQAVARSLTLGRPAAELFPDLVGQPIFDLLGQVYATGKALALNEEPAYLRHPDTGEASQGYFTLHYAPLHDGEDRVTGLLQTLVPVTEQVLAHQQAARLNQELAASNAEHRAANTVLHEAHRRVQHLNHELEARVQERAQQLVHQSSRLERLLQEAPAAICMLDGPNFLFELINPGYQRLFPNRTLLGKPVLEALPELVGSPAEAMLRNVYKTGTTFEGNEVLMPFARPSDGVVEDRYFDFIYQARYDEAGQIDGLVVFGFEVTEQVHNRQQMQQLNEAMQTTNEDLHHLNGQLTRTNTDLDTFVYAASHDLKAPIANIEGLLNALREYLPTEAQEPMVPRLVGMMEGAITRFQQTVGHLTDISHLQAAPEPAEAVDLARVLEDVRLDLLPLLESTQAELLVDMQPCPSLRFSAKNLRSVLFNLLSNAVKYRAPDRAPRVHVRTSCTATHLELEVQDNGLGLNDQQQAKLFTMFRRLHTHVEGSGVGLYLIKRTIENAGGTITVRSQPGVGSTFTVTLPQA